MSEFQVQYGQLPQQTVKVKVGAPKHNLPTNRIHVGPTPPADTTMLWADTSPYE